MARGETEAVGDAAVTMEYLELNVNAGEINQRLCQYLGLTPLWSFLVCALCSCFCSVPAFGDTTAHAVSPFTNDLCVVVSGRRSLGVEAPIHVASNEDILFKVFTSQVSTTLVYHARGSCYMELRDDKGELVSRTWRGRAFGKQLRPLQYANRMPGMVAGLPDQQPGYDMGGGAILPSALELFRIRKPGNYTLRVTIQILKREWPSPNRSVLKLVRFEPVSLTITHRNND